MIAIRFRENDYDVIMGKVDKANLSFTEFVAGSALGKP